MDWKKLLLGEWDWKRPFKSLAFIYLTLCVVACGFSNKFIFQPPPAQYTVESSHLRMLPTEGNRQVAAFWYPGPRSDSPVLLWSHGNAEDLGTLAPLFTELQAEGFAILAYDYPGYGLSDGSPSERSCYEAADAAFHFLNSEEKIPAEKILLLGQSVGTGPACWLAERYTTRGLVLLSPFRSAFLTVTRIPLLPGDKFKNHKRIGHIDEPLLVIHGTDDTIIPFADGKSVYEQHGGPKQFLPIQDTGHNDIWNRGFEIIVKAIKAFPPEENR